MSKKGKLILATALFGAALFGASCGGGGGTASTPPPPSPPPAPPPPSNVAKVLVLAQKGITSPGATVGLFEGTVRSNGTISWSSDLNPEGENDLDYYHEFSNRSVLLYDRNSSSPDFNFFFRYTAGALTRLTSFTNVVGAATSTSTITTGLADTSAHNIFLPNFVVIHAGDNLRIITSSGAVVQVIGTSATSPARLVYAGRDYLVARNGATNEHVYIIKKDGSVTILDWNDDPTTGIDPINGGRVRFLDRVQGTDIILLGHNSNNENAIYVILEDGTPVRITNSNNAPDGDDPVANISSGKIMRDAQGNIFVAINYTDSTNNLIQYFKIIPSGSGSVVFTPSNPINLGADASNPLRRGGYALDGNGRLYVIDHDGTEHGISTHFIDTSNSYAAGPRYIPRDSSGNPLFDEDHVMLAFANGVLVSNNPASTTPTFYHVLGINAPTNVALSSSVIEAVRLCNQVNNASELTDENGLPYSGIVQEPVAGEGTNRLMCASASHTASRNQFAWVQASGTGTYDGFRVNNVSGGAGTSEYLMATANSMIFRLNNQTFYECNFGVTNVTSCAARNLSRTAFQGVYNSDNRTTNAKIKSDNNILSNGADASGPRAYGGRWNGFAPNIRAVYFTSTVSAPYTANIQTGTVDTSTLNVVFSSAPARGGNISLELDRAANVVSPVSGAQCPSGYFDFVWYKDATYNFNNLTRPTNTCLIRVLQVSPP